MRRLLTASLTATAMLATTGPALADHVTVRPLTTACPANQVNANAFSDVAASSPFELAISCLADYEITRGRTATSYAPAGTVLRQQMAQFLYRLGSRAGVQWDTSDAGFRDLDALVQEARDAINALANAGVAQGRSAQVFDPSGVVTRGQMASFLARLADSAGADGFTSTGNAFDDDEELVHEPNIDRIAAAGVTTGRGSDRFFDPFSPVTREQMAAFLARTLDVLVDQDRVGSAYRADVAPVAVTLDQQGRLLDPGSSLTGRITGDRLQSASLTSPCVGTVELAREFSVSTDPQSPVGRCPIALSTTFDNGRTTTQPAFVVMPGYTDRVELVHVERVSASSSAGFDTSELRFVYDAPVSLPGYDEDQPLPFILVEYSGERTAAAAVRKDSDNEVLATFGTADRPVGTSELLEVSYASSGRGAVLDAQGRPGPLTTALLNPRSSSAQAYAGPTWQADLLSVTGGRPDPAVMGNFLVDFLFDAPLPKKYPGDFGVEIEYVFDLVLDVGSGRRCTPQTPLPARRVTVSCGGTQPDDEGGDIVRGLVSIRDQDRLRPYAATLLTRRPTPAPDLLDVHWGPSPNQITYVFDEPVQAGAPDRFQTDGPHEPFFGRGHAAEVSSADPRRVVVTLSGNEIDKNTLASALGGAVTSRATGRTNIFEQVQVPARVAEVVPAGMSLGTDLLRLEIDADAVAHYDFDAYFFPTEYSGQIEEDLRLYTPDGLELLCDGAGYDPRSRDASGGYTGYSTDLVCGGYSVGDDDGRPIRAATADEVRSAVLGVGAAAARVVEGARR